MQRKERKKRNRRPLHFTHEELVNLFATYLAFYLIWLSVIMHDMFDYILDKLPLANDLERAILASLFVWMFFIWTVYEYNRQ